MPLSFKGGALKVPLSFEVGALTMPSLVEVGVRTSATNEHDERAQRTSDKAAPKGEGRGERWQGEKGRERKSK